VRGRNLVERRPHAGRIGHIAAHRHRARGAREVERRVRARDCGDRPAVAVQPLDDRPPEVARAEDERAAPLRVVHA
jgi:hypothetical protein